MSERGLNSTKQILDAVLWIILFNDDVYYKYYTAFV
jgi:hypothetical protein